MSTGTNRLETFAAYAVAAARTADRSGVDLANYGLGIAGEAGEVANRLKKGLFHHGRELDRAGILEECGDVLWYIAAIAGALGADLAEVATLNIAKLRARYPDRFASTDLPLLASADCSAGPGGAADFAADHPVLFAEADLPPAVAVQVAPDELVGQVFFALTVLERVDNDRFGNPCYRCICECSAILVVSGGTLRSGSKQSCGCRRLKHDLTGKQFDSLYVIGRAPNGMFDLVTWRCRCVCGNEVFVPSQTLLRGAKKSCGCLRKGTPRRVLPVHKPEDGAP